MADVSSAHITEKDNDLLLNGLPISTLLYYKANDPEFGFVIFIPDGELLEEVLEDLKSSDLSKDFIDLVTWASDNCFGYIKIDGCGCLINKLNQNDW